jgi:hypothetical protein
MEERVPSDQGKLKLMDIPSTTFEMESSCKSWERRSLRKSLNALII